MTGISADQISKYHHPESEILYSSLLKDSAPRTLMFGHMANGNYHIYLDSKAKFNCLSYYGVSILDHKVLDSIDAKHFPLLCQFHIEKCDSDFVMLIKAMGVKARLFSNPGGVGEHKFYGFTAESIARYSVLYSQLKLIKTTDACRSEDFISCTQLLTDAMGRLHCHQRFNRSDDVLSIATNSESLRLADHEAHLRKSIATLARVIYRELMNPFEFMAPSDLSM